jgi:membrane protease YdiL (CAAX protease family)
MDPQQVPPGVYETQARLPAPPQTFIERLGISPVYFAILALVVVFLLYQGVGGIITFLLFGLKPTPGNVNGMRIMTGVSQLLFLLVPTLLMARMATFSSRDFFRLHRPSAGALLLPLIGIFSLQQVLQIYLIFQEKIPVPQEIASDLEVFRTAIEEAYAVLVTARNVPELALVIASIALVPAFAEEFLFRGLVQRSLETGLSPRRGVILTGIIFGAYHLNPFGLIPLVVLGIYLGFLAQRSDSIWTSVTAHFYNNCAAVVAVYLHEDPDSIITGNPHTMSTGFLLLTFWFFGVIFLVSTYYFVYLTRRPEPVVPLQPPPPPSPRELL